MLTLFGVSMMFTVHPDTAAEIGLLVLFYGLYFGVLGRDFAEICADKMASKLGVSFNFCIYHLPPPQALRPAGSAKLAGDYILRVQICWSKFFQPARKPLKRLRRR